MTVILLIAAPAAAVYASNGVPLHTVAHGKHHGTVSVTGGHGLAATPYSQSFTVPAGTVRFARLYVGVWGGTPEYTGSLETALNGASLGGRALGGGGDTNSMTYVSGFGVHWCAYDVTGRVRAGSNQATATTSGEIDGRIYGMVLAVATEDASAPEVEYWFAEGNENLNEAAGKNSAGVSLGAGAPPGSVTDARLYAVYIASTKGDGDLLLLNGQTIATDAAGASSGGYFDLRTYGVKSAVRASNTVGFGRGGATRLHPVFVGLVQTLADAKTPVPTAVPTAVPTPVPTAATTALPVTATTNAATAETTWPAASPTTAPTPAGTPEEVVPANSPPASAAEPSVATGSPAGAEIPPPAAPGPEEEPASTANASVPVEPGGGPAPAGAAPGAPSLGELVTADPVGTGAAVVLFALIAGAGILVFSVVAGAGLFSYRYLSRAAERTDAAARGPAEEPAGAAVPARARQGARGRADEE